MQSVLNQTCQDFELIVVDDASTDDTEEAVRQFDDHRVKYVRREENGGHAAARNTVLKIAKGEYIAFVDSDDEWLPTKLEKQVQLLEQSEADVGVIYSGCTWIDENGSVVRQIAPRHRGDILDKLLVNNCVPFSSVLLRKSCFDEFGLFDESLRRCPDWDMWIRIAQGYQFDFVQESLVRYLFHGESLSADIAAIAQARERIHRKIADQLARRRKIHSLHHFYSGNLYCHRGEMRKGRKELLRALVINPFRVRYYLCLAASLLGYEAYKRLSEIRQSLLAAML
jgi:glycosyltransferase involved in cell wall biosynthesis